MHCSKHCSKCCSWYCVISWLVLPIGIALLLHLIFKPCELHSDFIMWLLPIIAISYCIAWTILFLILTIVKCKSKNCCCCILKFLWFLIHIGIFVAVIAMNLHLVIHSGKNSQSLLNDSAKSNKLPSWFITIQNTKNCCGIHGPEDYGKILGSKSLISTCKFLNNSVLGNSTNSSSTANIPHSNFNCSIVIPGCKSYLNKLYRDCLETRITYMIVMLLIGLIPFVVCANSSANANINKVNDEEQDNNKEKDKNKDDKINSESDVINEDEKAKKKTETEVEADKQNKNPELGNSQGETTNTNAEPKGNEKDENSKDNSIKPQGAVDPHEQDLKGQAPPPQSSETKAVSEVHQHNPTTVEISSKPGENSEKPSEPQPRLSKQVPARNDEERRPSFLVQESNKPKSKQTNSKTNVNGPGLKVGSNSSMHKSTANLQKITKDYLTQNKFS